MQNFSHFIQKIGGYCLIVAGIICAIALSFHPDEFAPGAVLLSSWKPVHLGLLAAFTLSVIGVIGVFIFLNQQSFLNKFSFLIAVIGCIWSVCLVIVEVFVLPGIAVHSENQIPLMEMMDKGSSLEQLQPFFFTSIMIWIIGWILVGVCLLKNNNLPKYVGIIIILASICIAVPTHFAGGIANILHILFSLLFGVSWILLGYNITFPKNTV